MTIKPVLVPDHDAASLRKLMDSFAEASTGPCRQQLAESQAAVAAARKTITEGSISDLLNQDPTSPKFNDHPGASQLKKAKDQPKPYPALKNTRTGKVRPHPNDPDQGITEARNTYTVVFVDPSDAPKQIGTFDNAAEAKQLIRNSYREMYDTGDHLRNVAPGIYVLEEDYRNTGEQATADNYKHMYHWIIQKSSGVTEGSDDSGAYDKWDPKHPDFVKNYRKFQAGNPGATLKDYIADLKKGVTEAVKQKTPGVALSKAYRKDFDGKKPGQGQPETALTGTYSKTNKPGGALKKKNISEGIMDVVKQTFNDCVVGYPQGTSEGQFLQGWARAIRAETGREISLEKLTKLYHDYSKRSPEIMQSHGTMDEDSYKDTSGTLKDRIVGEVLNFYSMHGRIPKISEYSRAVRSKLNALDFDERSKLHRQANVQALKLAGKQGNLSKLGLDEGEGMSRAAKGYEKYGKAGMTALARAGREGQDLDPVRKRYDRYDEAVVEGAGEMPVNKYIANELDTLLKLAQDRVDDITNRSRGGYGNKKSSGLEDAIFEISGLSNGFHSSMEEGVAELQELNNGLPRIGNWIMRNLKKVGNRIDLLQLIKQGSDMREGSDDDEEEGDVCPECDGAGCPECYGDEDRDRAHDHAQGMERESAGMMEAKKRNLIKLHDRLVDLDDIGFDGNEYGKPYVSSARYDNGQRLHTGELSDLNDLYPNFYSEMEQGLTPTMSGTAPQQVVLKRKTRESADGSLQEHGDPWEDPNYDPRGGGETRSPEQIAKDNAEHAILSKKLDLKNTNKLPDIKDDMLKMMNHFISQHSKKKDVDESAMNNVSVPAALEMLKDARAYLDQFDPEDDDDYFDAYETIAAEFNMESNDSSNDPLTDLLDMYEVNPQQAAQMLADHLQSQSKDVSETADVKYGVFAKGGSVGSQRFRDDPLKTFDTKEEAIADARRRRSGLSKGERGYYRMGYVVKPIKGSAEQVDEGIDPVEQLRADIRRFAQ